MKTIISMVLFLLIPAFAFSQDNIEGKWQAKDLDNSVIKVYKEANLYYGKIVESEQADYIGQIVLKKFIYDQSKDTWKGTIYSPKRKMEITGTITLETPDKIKLIGRKYFVKKTFYWNRLE